MAITHTKVSGKANPSDGRVGGADFDAPHVGSLRSAIHSYLVVSGGTVNIPDADIGRQGVLLVNQEGNSAAGLLQHYRSGTFNNVSGIGTSGTGVGNNMEYRGANYSAGSGGLSWFIENNAIGGRLSVKNNLGFDIIIDIWDVFAAANVS